MKPWISASVGANAPNRKPDVETVQTLLNRVPFAQGGPTPALNVDGLCYEKTLAAISRFQKVGCGFQWPDRRIDPNRRTWNELVRYADDSPSQLETIRCYPRDGGASAFLGSAQSFTASQSVAGTPTAASLVADAQAHIPLAILWVTAMQARLNAVRNSIARFKVYSPAELDQARPFATHFKINIATQTDVVARARLDRVDRTLRRLLQALGAARLAGNPSEPSKAIAPLGGFDHPKEVITIGADFVATGTSPNPKAAVLIHECAHFVDAKCGHVASERPPPQRDSDHGHQREGHESGGQELRPDGLRLGHPQCVQLRAVRRTLRSRPRPAAAVRTHGARKPDSPNHVPSWSSEACRGLAPRRLASQDPSRAA